MKRPPYALLVFFSGCLITLGQAAELPQQKSKTWDVRQDFSWEHNPNDVWSYGWTTKPGRPMRLYRDKTPVAGTRMWTTKASVECPHVSLNGNKSHYAGVQPNALALHPGPSGQFSIVRWTSPLTGTVAVQGVFGAGDIGKVDVLILQDDQELFKVLNTTQDEAFLLKVNVKRGSKIDFIVGAGIDGYQSDSTPLEARITSE